MSVSHRYRNFGGPKKPSEPQSEANSDEIEDQKLQAFEAGYKAGWDDAMKAQSEERQHLSTELGQNLLDMSFTYHEALSKLTVSLEPAMRQIVDKLLPEMVRTALGAHILEQVQALLSEQVNGSVEIVVSPKNIEAVRSLVEDSLKPPLKIVGDGTLGEGQAFVRVAEEERQVDLDTMISEVSKAMTAFFHETAREPDHGK